VIVCGPSVEPMIAEPKFKFEGATTAHPVLSKTLTVLLLYVATATSGGPSPFRSVTATFIGPGPKGYVVGAWKVPSLFPRRMPCSYSLSCLRRRP
jgi:hypothetical protein